MAEETQVVQIDQAPFERLATGIEGLVERLTSIESGLEGRIQAAVSAALPAAPEPQGDPERRAAVLTGGERRADPTDRVYDRFDQAGWTRGDFEVAAQIYGAAPRMSKPINLQMPEDMLAGFRFHVFEQGPRPMVCDGNGNPVRAMDTQETGYGLELIGAQYVQDMWMAARNADSIIGRIRTIPMTAPTVYVPINGDLPEMSFVSENTSSGSSAYGTTKTGSNRVTLTAKKFTIQEIWSGELGEDSLVAFVPFLREHLNMSAALYLGSAYYNGDTTNAGTGNINLDDANPTDTKHYLAWDGIRHYWLVDATGQGKDMAAALDPLEITRARGKLNGGDDDIDNLIRNINWGTNPQELIMVMDWDTYMSMLELDAVQTIDKYGSQATIVTGELGRYAGIPIVSPAYASKTEADGKASDTEASNTKGQITLFNPRGFLAGNRRSVETFFDRIQGTDQFRFELYTRHGFTRFGGNVAAGIYDITV